MATVTRSRVFQAIPDVVERAVTDDVEAFVGAAGFDSVRLEDDRLELEQTLGLASLSLTLRIVDGTDAALTLEQEDGHFEAMTTEYVVEPADGGAELTARTTFTLGGVTGTVLDETLVRRQRGTELEAQFDYVERVVGE